MLAGCPSRLLTEKIVQPLLATLAPIGMVSKSSEPSKVTAFTPLMLPLLAGCMLPVPVALRLLPPDGGSVHFIGEDVFAANRERMRALRSKIQIVFQDPFASLDPRQRVRDCIEEVLRRLNHLHVPDVPASVMRRRLSGVPATVPLRSEPPRRVRPDPSVGSAEPT